jgi:rhodanese-related sulfurtransferase
MSPACLDIHPDMMMSDVLAAYPGARRALFAKYHVGGCKSCGFSDSETLAEVCRRNENLAPEEVVAHLLSSQENDARMQVQPPEVAEALRGELPPALIDVRSREEHDAVNIPGSVFLTQDLMREIFATWSKSAPLVLYCHHGDRSLDLAAYFIGHGFENAKCLAGGIDAWSCQVDRSLPRYRVEME